jgi:hypothetical protein
MGGATVPPMLELFYGIPGSAAGIRPLLCPPCKIPTTGAPSAPVAHAGTLLDNLTYSAFGTLAHLTGETGF